MPVQLTDQEMAIVLRGLMLAEDEARAIGDTKREADCRRLVKALIGYHDMLVELKRR